MNRANVGTLNLLRGPARSGLAAYRRFRLRREARDLDALLMSYPKSGRTWLRFILANYFAAIVKTGEPVDLHTMFAFLPNLA